MRNCPAKRWTPEEDAILFANPDKYGSQLLSQIPNRSKESINQRRFVLGLISNSNRRVRFKPEKSDDMYARPLTEETAYHIRKDYAAKIKLGYTHEKAIDWLVEANMRHRDVIEDVLTNPKYDADVAVCERRVKYTL